MPADVTLQLGGQNEELSTSYNSLMLALSLAVFLVYLVMASEFESFLHPLIVLFSVPLG
jgi:HAE1 family hydrophobic/amphiphilic exporter-1